MVNINEAIDDEWTLILRPRNKYLRTSFGGISVNSFQLALIRVY
jgi:hypothetical protein